MEAPIEPGVFVEPFIPVPQLSQPSASRCDLLLDPRHTGVNNLCEFLFLMQLGALQWQQIARFAGVRLREIRSDIGKPVYASFYYIRESFSPVRPLSAYAVDDLLTILSGIRLCGKTIIEGEHVLYGEDTPEEHRWRAPLDAINAPGSPASVRMSNVFVQMQSGPSQLKVTFPVNVDLDRFPRVERMPETYELVQQVKREQRFPGIPSAGLRRLGPPGFLFRYRINPDRDINGVGLVYFANYVAFLDMAERALLRQARIPEERIDKRSLVDREIAYYGNAKSSETIRIEVDASWVEAGDDVPYHVDMVLFDYRVRRESDNRLICISRARKVLPKSS